MSLAVLKSWFFPRSTPETRKPQPWLSSGLRADVEQQRPLCESDEKSAVSSEAEARSGFKIDGRVISDAIIGLSDGLTVPFALTAGLSALGHTKVVVYGGLAELIAGAISMGLGGYLGAKSEEESYKATEEQTRRQIVTSPSTISENLYSIFSSYDIPNSTVQELVDHLSESPKCVDFLMRFEHTLSEPAGFRAITCALTIASGYFIGGFIPLIPYMLVDDVRQGLYWSIGIMVIALFLFGYIKTCFVIGWSSWKNVFKGARGGVEMVVVGSVAAGAAMGLVMAFDHNSSAKPGGV